MNAIFHSSVTLWIKTMLQKPNETVHEKKNVKKQFMKRKSRTNALIVAAISFLINKNTTNFCFILNLKYCNVHPYTEIKKIFLSHLKDWNVMLKQFMKRKSRSNALIWLKFHSYKLKLHTTSFCLILRTRPKFRYISIFLFMFFATNNGFLFFHI